MVLNTSAAPRCHGHRIANDFEIAGHDRVSGSDPLVPHRLVFISDNGIRFNKVFDSIPLWIFSLFP